MCICGPVFPRKLPPHWPLLMSLTHQNFHVCVCGELYTYIIIEVYIYNLYKYVLTHAHTYRHTHVQIHVIAGRNTVYTKQRSRKNVHWLVFPWHPVANSTCDFTQKRDKDHRSIIMPQSDRIGWKGSCAEMLIAKCSGVVEGNTYRKRSFLLFKVGWVWFIYVKEHAVWIWQSNNSCDFIASVDDLRSTSTKFSLHTGVHAGHRHTYVLDKAATGYTLMGRTGRMKTWNKARLGHAGRQVALCGDLLQRWLADLPEVWKRPPLLWRVGSVGYVGSGYLFLHPHAKMLPSVFYGILYVFP